MSFERMNPARPISLFAAAVIAVKREQPIKHFSESAKRLYLTALMAHCSGDASRAAKLAGVTERSMIREWRELNGR